MTLSRYIAEGDLVHNYIWYRLNRRYNIDGPKYTVTPMVKLIHSYHKQMSLDRSDLLNNSVEQLYDNIDQLTAVLTETCLQLKTKNTTGCALTLMYVAFTLADRIVQADHENYISVKTVIDIVDKHFVSQTALNDFKLHLWVTAICGCIVTLVTAVEIW